MRLMASKLLENRMVMVKSDMKLHHILAFFDIFKIKN